MSNQLEYRYSGEQCAMISRIEYTHTSAKHIQLYGVSHLTRIIWSNHLEDYVFIITYLSKLHCNSANCNIHMVISFVFCCVFHFLVFFSFQMHSCVYGTKLCPHHLAYRCNTQYTERYAVACAQTAAIAVTMKSVWQKRSVA